MSDLAMQGDVRFVVTSKDKKSFLTLSAAATELGPVLQQAPDFNPINFKVILTYMSLLLDLMDPYT
jgi:hypothetical protein